VGSGLGRQPADAAERVPVRTADLFHDWLPIKPKVVPK
jgi:hypothetical protein